MTGRRINWNGRLNEIAEGLGWVISMMVGLLAVVAIANIAMGVHDGEAWAYLDGAVLVTLIVGGIFYSWLTTDDFEGDL